MRGEKREIDLLVLSDIHLGYRGCRADELFAYLKTVSPKRVVLCGDIIDIWQFRTSFWPESHLKVMRRLLKFAQHGVPLHYITGNHDEALRRYAPFMLGDVALVNELELELDGVNHWFVHGDRFDALLATPKWMAFLGCIAYDSVAFVTCQVNRWRLWRGRVPLAPASFLKRNLASAGRHIARFEEIAAAQARKKGVGAIICGHIHAANQRLYHDEHGERPVRYLNSGDWVESCTALEYADGRWTVHQVAHADAVEAIQARLEETSPVEAFGR